MQKTTKPIIIALGGNALNDPKGRMGYLEQLKNIETTAKIIADIARNNKKIVLTHGNGPQVGNILLQQEYAKEYTLPMPLSICGAQSQGQIGTMIVNALNNEFKKQNSKNKSVAIISHILTNHNDPAFTKPSKPIGPIYTPIEAEKLKKQGMTLREITVNAFRRVVPSPMPLKILELETIKILLEKNIIPVAIGGGGIPIVEEKRKLKLIDAVIDKDLASQLLANHLKADDLIILTNVKNVALNFQKSNQKWLNEITLSDAHKYLKNNEFGTGNMKPKIEAIIKFLENGGRKATIGHINELEKILNGKAGTMIVK